jgi:hypothetical protein
MELVKSNCCKKVVLVKYLLQRSILNEEHTRTKSQFLKNISSTDMITKTVCGKFQPLLWDNQKAKELKFSPKIR